MGLQIVVLKESPELIAQHLGDIAMQCEIFPISPGRVGVSVPTNVFQGVGEDRLRERLSRVNYYDLYKGQWVVKR